MTIVSPCASVYRRTALATLAGLCLVLVTSHVTTAQTLEQTLLGESRKTLAADALRQGNAKRGAVIFYQSSMTCSACHSVGDRPDAIGPNLAKIDKKTTDEYLVESILEPSKEIVRGYAATTLDTADGRSITGMLVEESLELILLNDPAAPGKTIAIKKSDVAERQTSTVSVMPPGQINVLADRRQFLDLVRYLIEVRDGGEKRARQLRPAPASRTFKLPDDPLPSQPVVQRGEVQVENTRHPRAVALGFVGGSVLFDADQLAVAAQWHGGFLSNSPQNYFGLFWRSTGGQPELFPTQPHPLSFKFPKQAQCITFEPPLKSDPNVGTRFDGYQVGKSCVRLHYRVLAGHVRIGVIEDIRAESRPGWEGLVRRFEFSGLPAGAQVSLTLPVSGACEFFNAQGEKAAGITDVHGAPIISGGSGNSRRVVRVQAAGATWDREDAKNQRPWRLISAPAKEKMAVRFRVDQWKCLRADATPRAEELSSLDKSPPLIYDQFPALQQPQSRPPAPSDESDPSLVNTKARPAISAKETVDEFPPTKGRFLRFVITSTNDNTAPGLDELEIYGAEPKLNLALAGKATASSVTSGYAIHQIAHLNDGKLGNDHSWVSAQSGESWVQIELPGPVEMRKIVWARDRTGVCRDRLASTYRIEISDDGKQWTKVGDESGRPARDTGPPIRPDAAPGYTLERIPLPFPGCRPSDVAFSDDGVMYAIAMTEGQIWRTRTPPVGHPQRVLWQRYAVGLYHPIGLAIVDGRLYVAQKPEITELIDCDGDGVVDQFRTVATGWGLSPAYHEYCFGLATDPQKNLWFALNTGHFWPAGHEKGSALGRWRGSVMRVTHDSEKIEEMARGCRVPNGIAQGPGGNIFYTDNQGDWIPVCKLACVQRGKFYGHPEETKDIPANDAYPDGHSAIWFPYNLSRSTAAPAYDQTAGRFGPYADQMFVGDVGYGANTGIMRVALEKVDGEYQGACFRFVDGQPFGCERMKFGPDNQLYMASLTSGLTRLAYTGVEPPLAILSIRVRPRGEGFVVQMTKPLAADTKLPATDFDVSQYHYKYWRTYGCPPTDEKKVKVTAASLSPDRKTITLTLPVEAHPLGMVYQFKFGILSSPKGEPLTTREAWYNVVKLPKE